MKVVNGTLPKWAGHRIREAAALVPSVDTYTVDRNGYYDPEDDETLIPATAINMTGAPGVDYMTWLYDGTDHKAEVSAWANMVHWARCHHQMCHIERKWSCECEV